MPAPQTVALLLAPACQETTLRIDCVLRVDDNVDNVQQGDKGSFPLNIPTPNLGCGHDLSSFR